MENQHRKIKGYRELSQTEIDLMNEVKAKGVELNELVTKIQAYLESEKNAKKNATVEGYLGAAAGTNEVTIPQYSTDPENEAVQEQARFLQAEPQRWAAIAKTDLQTGLMALTRAIAQPGFF